jgi:uncharacterized protein
VHALSGPTTTGHVLPAAVDAAALAASAPEGARIVCSDDDPFCPEGALDLYSRPLGVPADVLPGRGHLNNDAGLGPWPAVEAWAREGAVPITA